MCIKSGIPQLAQHLQTLSKSLTHSDSLEEARKKRLERRVLELCEHIDAAIAQETKLIEQVAQPYVVKAKAFVELIDGARRTFEAYTFDMREAREKLDNI